MDDEKKKKDIAKFRHEALENKFCEHLTIVCNILRDYGDLKDQYFNNRKMIDILKTERWAEIDPLAFYFKPLLEAITDMRKYMLFMNDEGVLRCKYIIEQNEELQKKIIHMVKMD